MVTETHPHIDNHAPAIDNAALAKEVTAALLNGLIKENTELREQVRIRDVHIRALTETIKNLRDELKQHRRGHAHDDHK